MVTTADDFLRVAVRGPGTRANMLATLQRVITETKSHNIWRVLVDATQGRSLVSAFDKFELGVQLTSAADRRMILAVVARAEEIDHFFETVARNRGGAVRVFSDEAAALQWLLGAAAR